MANRTAEINRKSKETEIKAVLNVDGTGDAKIKSPIGLLNHMIELFSFHGYFDLNLDVQKSDDQEIDIHHTNEDIGIVLGKVFKKALDEKEGIRRFGFGSSPMEDTLGETTVDISGRGYLTLNVDGDTSHIKDQDGYAWPYLEHFLESFAHGLGATIHVRVINPNEDLHTDVETVFKSLGLALDEATRIDPRRVGVVPSTKGIID